MATIKNSKSFFEIIPREIRDQIYGLTFDHDIERQHFTFQFQASCPHLRLVSRQFKEEYDEQDGRTPKSATLLATVQGEKSILTLPHPNDRGEWHNYEARMPHIMGPSASAAGAIEIPRLLVRQSMPGPAKKCTSLQVNYFMPKPKPASWREEIDITHLVPDMRCIILDLERELQQAEILLVWKSTSTNPSFAIRCDLSLPSILSRLRTNRCSNAQFRDSFPLLSHGQRYAVRFVHQDFDSCGNIFQGLGLGGTFDNESGVFIFQV